MTKNTKLLNAMIAHNETRYNSRRRKYNGVRMSKLDIRVREAQLLKQRG
jgi:hypothetical protein